MSPSQERPPGSVFERRTALAAGAREVYRWHARPGAFARLVAPWEEVRQVGRPAALEPGALQELRVRVGPLWLPWRARIEDVRDGDGDAPRGFRDVQLTGPFARWEHTHSMAPRAAGGSELTDHVEYALPLGRLGELVAGRSVRRRLERLFDYRHTITARDLARHAKDGGRTMDVLVTGASGLVGSALTDFLTTGGHRVRRLVRREPRGADEFRWDPVTGTVDAAAFEGVDAVVHLAGENIASRRWTPRQKDRIRRSRVEGTRQVMWGIEQAERKPKVFVCASAIGWYGDRGDELLHECSEPGEGFLAEVCRAWEAEADHLAEARTVKLRFGVILSPKGGALKKMLTPFRLGAGGRIGDGKQWMSWVALDDVVGAIHHALTTEGLAGAVNVVAPNPVTNAEFTKVLGRVLRRPTVLPMPAPAARLVLGEMADELLLASARVEPRQLADSGYRFDEPELEGALRHLLGKRAPAGAA